MNFVHLHIERADYRAISPDTHPDDEFLDVFVGQDGNLVARLDVAIQKELGHFIRRDGDLAPADRFAILVKVDDRCLVRISAAPFGQQGAGGFEWQCQFGLAG